MNDMNDIEELVAATKICISKMKDRIATDDGKYVMASDTYIQVKEGKGLNGTSLLVRCPTSSLHAVCFSTAEEAYRNGDYYSKNGAGQSILLQPTLASRLFSEEITKATEMLDFITKTLATGQNIDEKVYKFVETEYIPEEGAKPERCIIIQCDKGLFRIIPIYFDLDGEQQVEVQKKWYDGWVFVATHAYHIGKVTKQIAYNLVRKSVCA